MGTQNKEQESIYKTHEFAMGFTHNEHFGYIEKEMRDIVRKMQDDLSMAILSDPRIMDKIREENEKNWEELEFEDL